MEDPGGDNLQGLPVCGSLGVWYGGEWMTRTVVQGGTTWMRLGSTSFGPILGGRGSIVAASDAMPTERPWKVVMVQKVLWLEPG